MKVKEAIELLKRYDPEEHIAIAIWNVNDVLERAEELEIKVTKRQATKIIEKVASTDASIGVSWDTIDHYLDDYESDEE